MINNTNENKWFITLTILYVNSNRKSILLSDTSKFDPGRLPQVNITELNKNEIMVLTFAYSPITKVSWFAGAAVPSYCIEAQCVLITVMQSTYTLIML